MDFILGLRKDLPINIWLWSLLQGPETQDNDLTRPRGRGQAAAEEGAHESIAAAAWPRGSSFRFLVYRTGRVTRARRGGNLCFRRKVTSLEIVIGEGETTLFLVKHLLGHGVVPPFLACLTVSITHNQRC